MTTKQELFELYMEASCALKFLVIHAPEDVVGDLRGKLDPRKVERARKVAADERNQFTRACNFVARQLGIWEER